MSDYTVESLINDNVKVNAPAKLAIKEFRRAKPWRGTFAERWAKFNTLHRAMCEAYATKPAFLFFPTPHSSPVSDSTAHACQERTDRPGNGGFLPHPTDASLGKVVLLGKLSVVTFLHSFCLARGMSRKEAFRWSLSVFKRFFPLSFSRCRAVGYMLVRE